MENLSQMLKHYVEMEKDTSKISASCVKFLEDLLNEIKKTLKKTPYITSKETLLKTQNEIEELIKKCNKRVKSLYRNEIEELIEKENEYSTENVKEEEEEEPKKKKSLVPSILFMGVAGYALYTDLLKRSTDNILKNVSSKIRFAYTTKQPIDDVVESVDKKEEKYKKDMKTDVETAAASAIRNTSRSVYAKAKKKVKWCAVLDSHSCLVCASYHGQIFEANSAPEIPVHENCRCILVPVEDNDNTEFEYNSFSEWIDSLSDDEKKGVLGKGRYELYKKGVAINSFIQGGSLIPLSKLKKT